MHMDRATIKESARMARALHVHDPGALRCLHAFPEDVSAMLPQHLVDQYKLAVDSLKLYHYAEAHDELWRIEERASCDLENRVRDQKISAQKAQSAAAHALANLAPDARHSAMSSFIQQQIEQMQQAVQLFKAQAKDTVDREHQTSLRALQKKYNDYLWWVNLSFLKQAGALENALSEPIAFSPPAAAPSPAATERRTTASSTLNLPYVQTSKRTVPSPTPAPPPRAPLNAPFLLHKPASTATTTRHITPPSDNNKSSPKNTLFTSEFLQQLSGLDVWQPPPQAHWAPYPQYQPASVPPAAANAPPPPPALTTAELEDGRSLDFALELIRSLGLGGPDTTSTTTTNTTHA